jgi:hypothetical protein
VRAAAAVTLPAGTTTLSITRPRLQLRHEQSRSESKLELLSLLVWPRKALPLCIAMHAAKRSVLFNSAFHILMMHSHAQ